MDLTKKYLRKLFKLFTRPELKVLPGNIAFFLVLSIFPIITLSGYFASFFNVSLSSVIDLVYRILPSNVSDILVSYITGNGMDFHVGFSIITGYIVASNGAHSIIVSCNTLYGFEHKNYLKIRLKALFITILLVFLFIFTLFVLAFGNSILKIILSFNIFDGIGDSIYYVFLLLKWPIAIVFIYFMMKIIFAIAPNAYIKNTLTTRGALFTSIAWILSTFVYLIFLSSFSF